MRTVGHRTEPTLQANASADALQRGLLIVDAAATFGWAPSTGQRKGVVPLQDLRGHGRASPRPAWLRPWPREQDRRGLTMEQSSRPATAADLKRVISALNASGARYLLIGAYALFAHGYQRATTDIDFVVEGTQANGRLVQQALLVLADQSAKTSNPAWFTEGENIRVADEITRRSAVLSRRTDLRHAQGYEQVVDLDGVAVPTVSLEGLLLTKPVATAARCSGYVDPAARDRGESMIHERRTWLLGAAAALAGCGFQLRQPPTLPMRSIALVGFGKTRRWPWR